MVYKQLFSIETSPNCFSLPAFWKKKKNKKIGIVDKNHGLTRLEQWKFFNFFILTLYRLLRSIIGCYVSKTLQNDFSLLTLNKKVNIKKFRNFDLNHGPTPYANCKHLNFLKLIFLWFIKGCFLSKASQNYLTKTMDWPL